MRGKGEGWTCEKTKGRLSGFYKGIFIDFTYTQGPDVLFLHLTNTLDAVTTRFFHDQNKGTVFYVRRFRRRSYCEYERYPWIEDPDHCPKYQENTKRRENEGRDSCYPFLRFVYRVRVLFNAHHRQRFSEFLQFCEIPPVFGKIGYLFACGRCLS